MPAEFFDPAIGCTISQDSAYLPEEVVVKAREALGMSEEKALVTIDPHKFYVLIGEDMKRDEIYDMINHLTAEFNSGKGELIILNCKGNLKSYTIGELKLMRDTLDKLIDEVEHKNKETKSRYDILRDQLKLPQP